MIKRNTKPERPLRAFLSGHSPNQLNLSQLTGALSKRFKYEMEVSLPKSFKIWKGFAFVDFKDREEFLSFIRERRIRLQEFEMNLVIKAYKEGKRLRRYNKDFRKRKLEVENIPRCWGDHELEAYFEKFGRLENAYVVSNKINQNLDKTGVLIFTAKKAAKQCLKHNFFEAGGVRIRVFSSWKNGEEKIQQVENQQGDQNLMEDERERIQSQDERFGGSRQEFLYSSVFDYELARHQLKPTLKSYFDASSSKKADLYAKNLRINVSQRVGLFGSLKFESQWRLGSR